LSEEKGENSRWAARSAVPDETVTPKLLENKTPKAELGPSNNRRKSFDYQRQLINHNFYYIVGQRGKRGKVRKNVDQGTTQGEENFR